MRPATRTSSRSGLDPRRVSTLTPHPNASAESCKSEGSRAPVSMRWIVGCDIPLTRARSRWDIPTSFRACVSRLPKDVLFCFIVNHPPLFLILYGLWHGRLGCRRTSFCPRCQVSSKEFRAAPSILNLFPKIGQRIQDPPLGRWPTKWSTDKDDEAPATGRQTPRLLKLRCQICQDPLGPTDKCDISAYPKFLNARVRGFLAKWRRQLCQRNG